jgi:dTDP-4-amino-4,6-dideoxygalactose transaminase
MPGDLESRLTESPFRYFRGRVALAEVLQAAGVVHGDFVAIPAYSCSAVAEAVLVVGGKPLYVDIDPLTLNMDPADLHRKLAGKPKAVVIQHTFGVPADCTSLAALAMANNIAMIEDCCHTVGSLWDGRAVGTFGDAAFYSFEFGKPISVGLGGLAVAGNALLHERLRRSYADLEEPSRWIQARITLLDRGFRMLRGGRTYNLARHAYDFLKRAGFAPAPYREAAGNSAVVAEYRWKMGRLQSRRFESAVHRGFSLTDHRRLVARWYEDALSDQGVHVPPLDKRAQPVYLMYPVRVGDKSEALKKALGEHIAVSNNYGSPVHPFVGEELASWGYVLGTCPHGERAGAEVICLPTGRVVDRAEAYRAIRVLAPWLSRAST